MPLPSFCGQSKGPFLSGQSIFSPQHFPPPSHKPLNALIVAELAGTMVQEIEKVSMLARDLATGRNRYVCSNYQITFFEFLSRPENT